jgi:hypothetical protein
MKTIYQGPAKFKKSKPLLDEDGPFILALYLILIALFFVVGFAL